jgi:hypothetical protein
VLGTLQEEELMKVFQNKAKWSANWATAAKVINKAKDAAIHNVSGSESSDSSSESGEG